MAGNFKMTFVWIGTQKKKVNFLSKECQMVRAKIDQIESCNDAMSKNEDALKPITKYALALPSGIIWQWLS